MSEWREWGSPDWPDWQDAGKRIEVKYEDGTTDAGVLVLKDATPGPDEAPIFVIRKDDGTEVFFANHEFWRYL